MRTVSVSLLIFHLALSSTGCSKRSPTCTFWYEGYGPSGTVPIRREVVASGLETPWSIAFLSPTRLLVSERRGRILLVDHGVVAPDPVVTLAVHADAESGLLGIALSPSFERTRRLFVYYTSDEGGAVRNRIDRFVLAADGRSATSDRVILDGIPASPAHDGGRLRFGPDGMLYAGTGDAGDRDLSPSAESNAGKVLRMDEDGAPPPDNPWPGRLAFVKGARNVEAFDWLHPDDPASPIVVVSHGPTGELGRHGNDRVTVAERGADLGWPDTWQGCDVREGVTAPALAWQEPVPPGGAAFYRGGKIPEWRGSLIVGALRAKHVHRVVLDPSDPRRVVWHDVNLAGDPPVGLGRVRDVIMGPDGELYVTTSNCDGRGTCPPEGDEIVRLTR